MIVAILYFEIIELSDSSSVELSRIAIDSLVAALMNLWTLAWISFMFDLTWRLHIDNFSCCGELEPICRGCIFLGCLYFYLQTKDASKLALADYTGIGFKY